MQHIARLLEIPGQSGPPSPAFIGASGVGYTSRQIGRNRDRPLFNRCPGFAAPKRENSPGVVHKADTETRRTRCAVESPKAPRIRNESPNAKKDIRSRDSSSSSKTRSRDSSPRMPRPRSEEIPLELIKKAPNSVIDMAPKISILPRPQTPKVECDRGSIEPIGGLRDKDSGVSSISEVSEETSFIADEGDFQNGKGFVETV